MGEFMGSLIASRGLAGSVYNPICGAGRYILTPPESPTPKINGPAVFGVRPGSPFLYTIPATGTLPMIFSVDGLPAGLTVNESTGVISGTISSGTPCEYSIVFHVKNRWGEASKLFSVFVGETICLTPPLGWNSWNCWGKHVDQEKVLASARSMVSKGLSNYGWTYVNLDDAWQGVRGGEHLAIQPDPVAFADIKKMCTEVHALGLKVGIYSTPWMSTYAGRIGGSSDQQDGTWDSETMGGLAYKKRNWHFGAYSFHKQDALQWAEWGIDYLKYDWQPNDRITTLRMADALRNCGRDIVYSLSNSAPLAEVETFATSVNCWRTTGDLKDRWDKPGRNKTLRQVWEKHRKWIDSGTRGGPGHFPDADMLVVGDVVEDNHDGKPRPSRLTADEQYTHISLWSLWASPMLIGCPIETMDEFTLKLLTNAEVLSVHQDATALAGRSVQVEPGSEIVVKELVDGSTAIGLFNLNDAEQVLTIEWKVAGLEGCKVVRDLWRQSDVGVFDETFSAVVRPHGVVFVQLK